MSVKMEADNTNKSDGNKTGAVSSLLKSGLTMEKVLSCICFLAGLVFLTAALLGAWRHFFTMGICIAVGVMISDEDVPEQNGRRHGNK